MAGLNEYSIMQQVYSLYEGDVDDWLITSDEYLSARRYANLAINMWEYYDNTKWRELYTPNASGSGASTVTAGTFAYSTSSDFRFPVSYVRTVNNSTSTYFDVIPPEKVPLGDDNSENWCYFLGNPNSNYTVNFNPNLTLTTGDTLQYEYYKTATQFTASNITTEMTNPFFIVHSIMWRMYKNDGEDGKAQEEFQLSQQLLEGMRTDNMGNLWNLPYTVEANLNTNGGFGV